ncbi:MAG: hypothetical protein VX642_01360 [Bdellovibrionota bacterium]|nr:hypothetical protein [Bdellovibrionota bacterium]
MKVLIFSLVFFMNLASFAGDNIYAKRKYDFSREQLFSTDSQNSLAYFESNFHLLKKDWQDLLSPTSVKINLDPSQIRYFSQKVGGSFDQIKLSFSVNKAYNLMELAAINSDFDRISTDLIECSGSKSVSQYYLEYKFKNCPNVKKDIEALKYKTFSFLLNSPLNGDHKKELMEIALLSPSSNKEQDLVVSNVIRDFPFRTDYFFREELSLKLPLRPQFFNPLFIQTLIEFSSFNIYPLIVRTRNGLEVGDILEKTEFNWFTPNEIDLSRSEELSSLVERSFYSQLRRNSDKYTSSILGLTDFQKESLKSVLGEDQYNLLTQNPQKSEKTLNKWTKFPQQLERVLSVVHNSYRLLANISFFADSNSFGLYPMAAALYFSSIIPTGKWGYDLIGPYPGIVSRNLSGAVDYPFCYCYRALPVREDFAGYRQIDPWRYFVRDLFLNIDSLEFDDE